MLISCFGGWIVRRDLVDGRSPLVHDRIVTKTPVGAEDPAAPRLVAEMFLKAAGPALVKRVAEILQKQGIPLMPLKGVLLRKLVYGEQSFRPIADVDILVPEAQFPDACRALRREGFTDER